MKTFGPDLPSATPASDARAQHKLYRKLALRRALLLQALALRDGALEALRTAGVVLAVLWIVGEPHASMAAVLALIYSPQLYGLVSLAAQLAHRAWYRWRMREAD
jgi:hypothetical protein